MPRRNNRTQRARHREPWQPEEDDTPTTTEAMARDLVKGEDPSTPMRNHRGGGFRRVRGVQMLRRTRPMRYDFRVAQSTSLGGA